VTRLYLMNVFGFVRQNESHALRCGSTFCIDVRTRRSFSHGGSLSATDALSNVFVAVCLAGAHCGALSSRSDRDGHRVRLQID